MPSAKVKQVRKNNAFVVPAVTKEDGIHLITAHHTWNLFSAAGEQVLYVYYVAESLQHIREVGIIPTL